MADDSNRQETVSGIEVPEEPEVLRMRIRDWKGLLQGESRAARYMVFAALFVLSSAMTFTQFGFIGIGVHGEYVGYALGLLFPVAATALLLGKGAASLQGLLSGIVLFLHSTFQPLDLVERYFVSVLNSVVLYPCCGFVLGLLFAFALHNGPSGWRKRIYLVLACLIGSVFATVSFLVNVFVRVIMVSVASYLTLADAAGNVDDEVYTADLVRQWGYEIDALGSLTVQCLLDFVILVVVVLVTCQIVKRKRDLGQSLSLRTSFSTQMFVVVTLVFCVLSAASFVLITTQAKGVAYDDMIGEAHFIADQVVERDKLLEDIDDSPEADSVPMDVLMAVVDASNAQSLVEGYDLKRDGTIVVFSKDGFAWYSNSPAYPVSYTVADLFGASNANILDRLSKSGEMYEMLYDTRPFDGGTATGQENTGGMLSTAELGYMCVVKNGNYYVLIAQPASMVYTDRTETMNWSSLLVFALLAAVYALSLRVLKRDVAEPIDRTNESLALITGGDLETEVTECGTAEFSSLSSGINTTVGALRDWIHEAETRMETELSTAKAIQESALPRVFPPFPEIDRFDIFASMDPAREVGGDFYDFFLIDDDTLGFLIADVSGKGIPGALFMMTAKTQIENYMATGMELSQAIATANERLCATNDAGMFVTVWAATLDIWTGKLTYVNAGHNFPLLRHGVGGEWEWLKKKCGLFLGTFETAKYRQETLTLETGDELLLYTDGVNEAFNVNEEEYGNDRLEAFLTAHADMHAREIVRALRADVAAWAAGAEQSDDVTILALEYGVAPEVTGTQTFDATTEGMHEAVEFVNKELERRLSPLDVQRSVERSLCELFSQACRYADTDGEEPKKVQVGYAYNADPSRINVELRDRGTLIGSMGREDPSLSSTSLGLRLKALGVTVSATVVNGTQNVVVFKKDW